MEQTEIEKKAEEYIMREDVVTENDRVPVDNGYGWQTVSFEDEVKRAYIDGYKDGQKHEADKIFDEWCSGTHDYPQKCGFLKSLEAQIPQWHEIQSKVTPKREISKEYMPKPKEKVFLKYHFYNDTEIHYSDGYYDNYDFEFHIPNNPTGRIICVIAWCELPKFEE